MTSAHDDPRSRLPLTPLAFHVLLALAEESRHVYGIIQEVDARTDGLIKLRTGTLYTLLQRLLGEGLIAPAAAPVDTGGATTTPSARHDERRRYYSLTAFGREVVEAEAKRLEDLVFEARRKHILGRPSRA
jgi:DNA-binding PadR family transcriptional regulator